ncbi:LLM class flavin-dependent oxidoreductase [Mycolicibacterium helvum]|uniref:Phthiodiolone/phenolphthiodiolone dimycocerosates ketoreductase n=1 Tax=Mycolicibacterium helvum TaxID=1534349 RepID=A0A7I7T2I1_9MYCO|nr:LLM class flavin-dependent oxidoreductase [Mycolicibacterium helvum]BBY62266.1 phthiodiolone/phenolphthiodiolone dimycocerosates ketoreductase [Mycolicibacterium helvum]
MDVSPAAFLRTTLPLDLSCLSDLDSGRYHSVWLPDHMVSFWPDALWTPEFTDLATVSPSPHRHLDGMAVAAAAAVLTSNVRLATSVVDTVRRHPALLAQSALTVDHLSRGRFILGLGSGETENVVPYGFEFAKPVSRFEEALKVIRLLWDSPGPVDFQGQFYHLEHARLDTEPYADRLPPIWIGASGPRMLEIVGRYADGWWPAGAWTPEQYAQMLGTVRQSAEHAGRDPMAITPCFVQVCLIGEHEAAIERIVRAPLVASFLLQVSAGVLRRFGFDHPMGADWGGFHAINPATMTRERIVDFLGRVDPEAILAVVPHGTPTEVARIVKSYVDAGLRVPKILDYSTMAGLEFAAASGANVRRTEDELLTLCKGQS